MRILMCEPRYFSVFYSINPWMTQEIPVDSSRAIQQWDFLCRTLEASGATIERVPAVEGLPDMVFTANAGLIRDKKVYLAHFKHPERQGESPHFRQWFESQGFSVYYDAAHTFEGAGDALFAGNKLFAASGFRSEEKFYELLPVLGDFEIVRGSLVDPNFYHLDTCFCPLDAGRALWWPGAFSPQTQKRFESAIELIAVPEDEAKRFACNAVILDKTVVLPTGCETTCASLAKLGFTTKACDMSEYLKSGGACKCLTLRLDEV